MGAIALPIWIALSMSRQQSVKEQVARAGMIADEVLRRSDESSDHTLAALDRLEAIGAIDPCADKSVALMQELAISSGQILAVLFIARQQLSLPVMIKAGLARNEFFLLYQPLVDMATGKWVGTEALIRWRREDGEIVPPDIFIPVAERGGLIRQVTAKVIELAIRDSAQLLRRHPGFHIAINLSAEDLQSPETFDALLEGLLSAKILPANLLVEVTERVFANTETVRHAIHELRTAGIGIAIDDFGTGYSSLSYLASLEVDYLKIDKSFVDAIGTNAATSNVVLHIIDMAKSLNISLIAEGVETEPQADFMRAHGVHNAQGWLYGKPMPIDDLARQLESGTEQPVAETA